MTDRAANASQDRQWCVAAALKSELAAVRALRLQNVVLIETGVGPMNAERTVRKVFDNDAVGGIIHIGFAGALSRSLALGDVLVASVVEGEATAPAILEAPERVSSLLPPGVRSYVGTILTRDRILAKAGEKRDLAEQRPADNVACVDMESAPIAHVCMERKIPYVGIRAITDTLDEDLPMDLNECRGRDGNIESMRVMWSAVHHPSAISGLLELRRRARDCSQTLARCVKAFIEASPSPLHLSNGAP